MADALSLSTTVHGRVVAVNDKGVKLEGDASWLNFSKYAVGIVPPERGQTVAVTMDSAGFVRSVTAVNGAAGAPAPLPVAGGSQERTDKDRTITRLAVLKAAAEFGAARPNLRSGEVLAIAESWERWVLRSDAPTDDLAEAF